MSSNSRLYIGNLSYSLDEADLRGLLSPYGVVHTVEIILDRETGRSRGFGFAEMDQDAAWDAISALNRTEFAGRPLVVKVAEPRKGGQNRPSRDREYDREWSK